MNNKTKIQIKDAFDSILRADYLSIDNKNDLLKLSDYFVDPFNAISSILQKQDSFISGRRGTGKTTALFKGYYECLKTLEGTYTSNYFNQDKVMPLYIDLSNCIDIFESENDSLLEIHFVRQLIDALKKQIESLFDEKHLLLFKKENPALDDLELISRLLIEGQTVASSKDRVVNTKKNNEINNKANTSFSSTSASLSAELNEKESDEYSTTYIEKRALNLQEFLNKIKDIMSKAKIDYLYLFLDEFSDLNNKQQQSITGILKSLLGSKINLFLKIGVITDRYDFGDNIILGRDIFHIPLDLNEHVERLGGLTQALLKFESTISELIDKRFDVYGVKLKFKDILKSNEKEIISRISRESIGVTRTIGLVLQNAWKQAESSSNIIGLTEINYGIRSTRKTYFKQYEGAIKRKLIPGFNNDIWNTIIEKAISEKNRHKERPASHFLIDPKRNHYLNVLKENFMIHLLEEGRSSKHGGNYNLYSIDYDICQDLNIKYAENKDEYTAVRFIYDDVLSKFDGYFAKEKLKSFKCPECDRIYEEVEVANHKIKRCFEDDTKLDEIIHQEFEATVGNFAEVEVKILGLITMLDEQSSMSAVEIANAVGCKYQKVSGWCSRVLGPKGDIQIHLKQNKNHYFTDSSTLN